MDMRKVRPLRTPTIALLQAVQTILTASLTTTIPSGLKSSALCTSACADVGSFVPIVLVPGVANPVNLRNVIEARRVQQQQPPVSHTDIAFGAPKHDARATQNAPPQDEIACDSQGYGKAPRDRRAYDCGEVPGLTIYNKLVRTGKHG